MAKRMIAMLVVVIAVIAVLGGFKYSQIKTAMSQDWTAPPEAVTTVVATQQPWNATLSAIGTVAAVQGVTVSADLPGVVTAINFDSGRAVGKGDVLVQLDTKQERAQLAAAEAAKELTRLSLARKQELLGKQAIPQATYDEAQAKIQQLRERDAFAAGNSTDDIRADWIDYEAAGVRNGDELTAKALAVLRLVEMEQEVVGLGLASTADSECQASFAAIGLEARARESAS